MRTRLALLSPASWRQVLAFLAAVLLLGGPLLFPLAEVYLLVFGLACYFAALAMAWNILALSGLYSLGHGAFFGLGAYSAIILEQHGGWPIYGAVLAGGLVGAAYGACCGGWC